MATADRNPQNRPQDAADSTAVPPTPPVPADADPDTVLILDPDTADPTLAPPDGADDLPDTDEASEADEADANLVDEHGRRLQPAHEFLVPGPDATTDSGTLRWGLTWIFFSLLLIVFMLGVSFVCWLLASWTGLG